MTNPLLEIKDLSVEYVLSDGVVRAAEGVNLTLDKGDFFGLVGESGCGKTTTALSILRSLPPHARIASGQIIFDGKDLTKMDQDELRNFRWRRISMVFQASMNSLNPVFRVGDQISEAIRTHSPEVTKQR